MKKCIILLIIALLVQPYSFAAGTKNTMQNILTSWYGENINSVISTWGYPSDEKLIAGRKLFLWTDSHFYVSGNQYGTYGGESSCIRILEVDKHNNVINGEWKGNSCPATYMTGKKWVNQKNNPWNKESAEL